MKVLVTATNEKYKEQARVIQELINNDPLIQAELDQAVDEWFRAQETQIGTGLFKCLDKP